MSRKFVEIYLEKHFPVSHETIERLQIYHDTLLKWNQRINLISKSTENEAWQRHFLDTLQLLPLLPTEPFTLADIGSGAGFPGLVLALCTGADAHLIDSDEKKIIFLKHTSFITGSNINTYAERIENISLPPIDVFTSRACSDLATLLNYCSKYVSHETICLFPKGKNYSTELEEAKKYWEFDCKIIPSITEPQAVILKLSRMRKKSCQKLSKIPPQNGSLP